MKTSIGEYLHDDMTVPMSVGMPDAPGAAMPKRPERAALRSAQQDYGAATRCTFAAVLNRA